MKASGFSLVELMVVVVITTIVMTALVRFMATSDLFARRTWAQGQANEIARVQLNRMAAALREVRYSVTGAYPLVTMEPQRIIFYADVDADDTVERIRYELAGTQLIRGVTEPSGTPLTYDVGTEESNAVASYVRNGSEPVFTYYRGDYPVDQTALSPIDLTEVKYIQFQLLIDVDPAQEPPPIDVVSQVQLRNLKTNLGAAE